MSMDIIKKNIKKKKWKNKNKISQGRTTVLSLEGATCLDLVKFHFILVRPIILHWWQNYYHTTWNKQNQNKHLSLQGICTKENGNWNNILAQVTPRIRYLKQSKYLLTSYKMLKRSGSWNKSWSADGTDGSVQNCGNSSVLAMELLPSCNKLARQRWPIELQAYTCINGLVANYEISILMHWRYHSCLNQPLKQ